MAKIGRPTKLTRELAEEIAQRIRAGSFPVIAAASCGISPATFYRWQAEGRKKGGRKKYREFWDMIWQAVAVARVAAEIAVFRDNPLAYLTRGPGKRVWHPDHPEDAWRDDLELSIRAAVQLSGNMKQKSEIVNRPAPISHLAHAFLLLEEMGLRPANALQADSTPVKAGD